MPNIEVFVEGCEVFKKPPIVPVVVVVGFVPNKDGVVVAFLI